jgi:hypothetical protein
MQKKFKDLAIGEKFVVDGVEYVKTQTVKVSCCRSINSYESANASKKHNFDYNTLVTAENNG